MPAVTVIMPVFNGARFLSEAIDSVLAQTWKDWELVIIDDGSTDSTPSIIAGYTDSRIRSYRQINGGEAVARNKGLDLACGEWIAFLDADDLYLPSALEDHLAHVRATPGVDVSVSDGYIVDVARKPMVRLSELRGSPLTGNVLERLVLSPNALVPCCASVRRSALQRYGVRFDDALVIGPDYDFWVRLARHACFGTIEALTDTVVKLKIAENVLIDLSRSAIAAKVGGAEPKG